jgi:hypothetical protein
MYLYSALYINSIKLFSSAEEMKEERIARRQELKEEKKKTES